MGFSFAITKRGVFGDLRGAIGTYVSDSGSTGGDLDLEMKNCYFVVLQPTGAAINDSPRVNETMPCDGAAITIVAAANEVGVFFALGV